MFDNIRHEFELMDKLMDYDAFKDAGSSSKQKQQKLERKPESKAEECGNEEKEISFKKYILNSQRMNFPEIIKVVYDYANGKTSAFFGDGTASTVKICHGDKFDPERGLIYAILKRLYGNIRKDGTVSGSGYIKYLEDLEDSASWKVAKQN